MKRSMLANCIPLPPPLLICSSHTPTFSHHPNIYNIEE